MAESPLAYCFVVATTCNEQERIICMHACCTDRTHHQERCGIYHEISLLDLACPASETTGATWSHLVKDHVVRFVSADGAGRMYRDRLPRRQHLEHPIWLLARRVREQPCRKGLPKHR